MSFKIMSRVELVGISAVLAFVVIVFVCCDKITVDRMRGVKFSDDGRTLISFSKALGYIEFREYTIPAGVEIVGERAFIGARRLRRVNIPPGVTVIGDRAFGPCVALESIELPMGVTSIGAGAFEGCLSLKSVKIPDSVRYIGKRAFAGCGALEQITIPPGVASIGEDAFADCPCEAAVKQQFSNYTATRKSAE